jgi:pimeloyl-ACP methyl ester carboxylesterase
MVESSRCDQTWDFADGAEGDLHRAVMKRGWFMRCAKNSADAHDETVEFYSNDGIRLRGVVSTPTYARAISCVVFAHGEGRDKDDCGLFASVAKKLAVAGHRTMRFDLRGHGQSEGEQEELTVLGVVNDIRSAVHHIWGQDDRVGVTVVGAGISAFAALHLAITEPPPGLDRILLVNPVVDMREEFVDKKPYWRLGRIDATVGRELLEHSFLPHLSGFRLGRPFLNEVLNLRPKIPSEMKVGGSCICKRRGSSDVSLHGVHADSSMLINMEQASEAELRSFSELMCVSLQRHGHAEYPPEG